MCFCETPLQYHSIAVACGVSHVALFVIMQLEKRDNTHRHGSLSLPCGNVRSLRNVLLQGSESKTELFFFFFDKSCLLMFS